MDIKDKYLGIWVTRAELESMFSLEPATTASGFLVAGTVVGEAPGVGLWVQLETVSTLGERDIFPDLAKERPRRLIRWDYIHAAELFDHKTELERAVGFRPPVAA
jgi:ligand-binding SRPBCC domain-containing protein